MQDASGLLYLRARYLSTSNGRFTSVDPFSGFLNYPASMNPYQYAYNNPLRYVDRTGMWVIPVLIIGSGLLAGGIEAYNQYQQNGCIDWGKVGIATLAGAGAMAVGIFVGIEIAAIGTALLGEGLLASIAVGAVSGIISGQASRLVANLILGNPLNEGLGNPKDILIDGLLGGIGGAVGYGLKQIALIKAGKFVTKSGSVKAGAGHVDDIITTTEKGLFAFGNKTSPRGARPARDFGVDELTDLVGPEKPPLPKGASTVTDVNNAPLSGHYHNLPSGTVLPDGLGVIADGIDVIPNSPHGPGHHTFYPTSEMPVEDFNDLFKSLPWQYGGKK